MSRVVDLDRYRAPILAIGAVLAVLVVVDVALRLACGAMPAPLLRASFHNPILRDEVAGRVAAVVADRAAYRDRPLAVVVGSSSARAGLRPSLLDPADPDHHRWLALAGTGSSFDELRYTFAPLFDSGLDADLVVVAVHPGWLAGRLIGDPAMDQIMVSESASRRSWLLFHRGRLHELARTALADLRRAWLLGLGGSFAAVYPPAADPWTEPAPSEGVLDPARHDAQLAMWQRKRWFDPAWFDRADREIADARAVIAGCRRAGRRVVVVLMPESSALRARMPVTAEAALRRAVAGVADPPPIVDLRAAIPDRLFADNIHVNLEGAARLSTELTTRLAAWP